MTYENPTKHVQLHNLLSDGYGSLLTCPACQGDYTHHWDVQVFERGKNDVGLCVRISAGAATVEANMAGYPSLRRHGLTICMNCDGCGAVSLLGLEHRKGQTFLRWLQVGPKTNAT